MKKRNIALIALTAISLGSTTAFATGQDVTINGGTIHFTGNIVDAACSVSTNSEDQTVNLGEYRASGFTAAATTTAAIPFQIVLNDCSPATSSLVSIAFSGQTDATDTTLLTVNAGGTNDVAATGVGIQIQDNTSKVLSPNGSAYSASTTLNTGTNTLAFTARYKSTAATVTAGQANADATFIVHYE